MTDPISVASFALSLGSKATDVLNAIRERAQRSKDAEIKQQINTLYDVVLQMKEAMSRLIDENKKLKQQIENEHMARVAIPKIKQVGDTNYYFQGDEGPYCQPCYDTKGKLVTLPPSEPWSGGIRRECPVCHEYFYEKRMDRRPFRLGGRRGGGGPNSWME